MKTSAKGRKFIEGFEGLILQAYDDANDHIVAESHTASGTLTIGYGHTDAAGPPRVYVGQRITQNEADTFLANDLASVESEVNHLVKVHLNQDQFDALVSFQFNTGHLGQSSILTLLNSGKYSEAADHLLAYNHANGQVMVGLTRRREAERAMFLTPQVGPKPVSHVTTAVVTGGVIATAAAAGNASSSGVNSYEALIAIGFIMVIAIAVGLIMHFYNKGKTNVISVQPVVVSKVDLG